MSDNFFKRFTEWQNYAHYVLLWMISTIIIALMINATQNNYILIFWLLPIIYLVADSITHAIFWFLPEKYGRWRD